MKSTAATMRDQPPRRTALPGVIDTLEVVAEGDHDRGCHLAADIEEDSRSDEPAPLLVQRKGELGARAEEAERVVFLEGHAGTEEYRPALGDGVGHHRR